MEAGRFFILSGGGATWDASPGRWGGIPSDMGHGARGLGSAPQRRGASMGPRRATTPSSWGDRPMDVGRPPHRAGETAPWTWGDRPIEQRLDGDRLGRAPQRRGEPITPPWGQRPNDPRIASLPTSSRASTSSSVSRPGLTSDRARCPPSSPSSRAGSPPARARSASRERPPTPRPAREASSSRRPTPGSPSCTPAR
jgi:hypothetical protein